MVAHECLLTFPQALRPTRSWNSIYANTQLQCLTSLAHLLPFPFSCFLFPITSLYLDYDFYCSFSDLHSGRLIVGWEWSEIQRRETLELMATKHPEIFDWVRVIRQSKILQIIFFRIYINGIIICAYKNNVQRVLRWSGHDDTDRWKFNRFVPWIKSFTHW